MNNIIVRQTQSSDISFMVQLSHEKRREYEKTQPVFWRHAENAEEIQTQWFMELLDNDQYILLVAQAADDIVGFIIGQLIVAPPVYHPGGLTLMIDDFCVAKNDAWLTVGKQLILEIQKLSKNKKATQILVACGAHDDQKKELLRDIRLTVATEWYIANTKS